MNLNVSPQIRVVVLAGLVALLGLAVLLFAFGHRSPSATPSTPTPTPGLVPATTHTGPAVHGHVKPAAQSRPVAKHAVKAPRVAPAVKAAVAQGWPRVLADRFASRKVVVVALYSPDVPLDRQALAEATAGATRAGAAFFPVDVSTADGNPAFRAIIRKSETVGAPVTLILRRPGKIFVRFDGFQDQASVAQAAANAALS